MSFLIATGAMLVGMALVVWQLVRTSRQNKAKQVVAEDQAAKVEGYKTIAGWRAKQNAEKVNSTDADNIANF